jgi:hypothetical protein
VVPVTAPEPTDPPAGPFSGLDPYRAEAEAAARAPEVGMGFHEMYSCWFFVTGVAEFAVQAVHGGGHPTWFPECGVVWMGSRDEFEKLVRCAYVISDHRYNVAGWAERAEGLTVEELEQRIAQNGGTR